MDRKKRCTIKGVTEEWLKASELGLLSILRLGSLEGLMKFTLWFSLVDNSLIPFGLSLSSGFFLPIYFYYYGYIDRNRDFVHKLRIFEGILILIVSEYNTTFLYSPIKTLSSFNILKIFNKNKIDTLTKTTEDVKKGMKDF